MGWGLRSLVPMGSNFSVPSVELEAGLPCLHPSLPPSPGNQQLQPVGHGEPGLQNATSPFVEVCVPAKVLAPTPPEHGLSHHSDRSQAEILMQSPGKAPLPLPKALCSPSWKRGGLSLSALRANSSHQLIALFPRAVALAAGSQLAGGYRYFMQTWRETSPVSHSQGVAPKQHRDLSQHICGICANWPDCLNNSVYIYKL